ncbi:peptidase S41 [Elizabethkingia meningoseptica]|uniref:S41 family peptidase n=1 Tax=Elizabethkingia meningoseptica TaxID=238 RepID=UPI00099A4365|nr:S41 family peptidase [Elizabethkingia meningoseptica]OPB94945.1 peptidase S41 [Elizabethkingia meningoseptica]
MKELIKNIKTIVFVVGMLLAAMIPNSCVQDNDIAMTEPERISPDDIKSYADLFKTFWNVMDERYNYFYEQKRRDGMDWGDVYNEYYPKFQALRTYDGSGTTAEKQADMEKAKQYFTDIIDPIIDRHFYVSFLIFGMNTRFYGGMKSKQENIYPFGEKYNYIQYQLVDPLAEQFQMEAFATFGYMTGKVKADPSIRYLTFNSFFMSDVLKVDLRDQYLVPDAGNKLLLTEAEIVNSPLLSKIKDADLKNEIKNYSLSTLNQFNTFFNSVRVKNFNAGIKDFKNTEIVSDTFVKNTEDLLSGAEQLGEGYKYYFGPLLTDESIPYMNWFSSRMTEHVEFGYGLNDLKKALRKVLDGAPFYREILNPLHKGEIKKLILDLRGNGGGSVMDARFFVDRLITKKAIFSYQRTKEGNGRFNYTPWIPAETKPHQFGIPSDIPIVVLTDKGSASMAEMTTLMLRSQGNQVISIGDYSAGATAGLAGSDDFNGGIQGFSGVMFLYMPLMAMKDASGNIVEGVGVKPNIYVSPPSDAEINAMSQSPETFVDRVMNEAVKYLSSK